MQLLAIRICISAVWRTARRVGRSIMGKKYVLIVRRNLRMGVLRRMPSGLVRLSFGTIRIVCIDPRRIISVQNRIPMHQMAFARMRRTTLYLRLLIIVVHLVGPFLERRVPAIIMSGRRSNIRAPAGARFRARLASWIRVWRRRRAIAARRVGLCRDRLAIRRIVRLRRCRTAAPRAARFRALSAM